MIISHEHKFIFLKTKKTAGTSIELALSRAVRACGRHYPDHRQRRGVARRWSGPRNWRLHGWWQSPRPLFKRRWLKLGPRDYGFYNHMPAAEARAR